MKWKNKVKPKENEVRYRTIFPIIPTKIGEYTYWLESVDVMESFLYNRKDCRYKWRLIGLDSRP